MEQLLPFVLIFVVMYFFMIRPQMRKQKQERKFIEELKKGDKIVTKSGLHGKILEVNDTICVIETMAGKLMFDRTSISMDLSNKIKK